MRMRYSTGWSRGKLITYVPDKSRAAWHTFTVRFLSDQTDKEVRLRLSLYDTDRTAAEGSWHIIVPPERLDEEAAAQAQERA
jgi:hypothetical protein